MSKSKRRVKPKAKDVSFDLDVLTKMRERGVKAFAMNTDGSWSVEFVQNEDDSSSANVVGFSAPQFQDDAISDVGPAPALAAAAAARREIFTAPVTGVAPEVIAEVEAAAARFEFESGLIPQKIVALQRRIDNAKTEEERQHYMALLAKEQRDELVYAHS